MSGLDGYPERYHVLPNPLEGVRRAAKFLGSIIFNTNVPLHMSNHYVREHFVENTGAAPMLDAALDQPTLPFIERPDASL